MKTILLSLRTTLLMSLLLGLVYPLAITGLSQVLFPHAANGSLVRDGSGAIVGSSLIGQDWSASPAWFSGRPSATGGSAYNPQASGGSNLSPHGKAYADRVESSRAAWTAKALQAGQTSPVPAVLLTASGSGLDPHLDLDAALWQAPIVAHARSLDTRSVENMVKAHVVPAGWPWDPAPFVNLLELNQDLDRSGPRP